MKVKPLGDKLLVKRLTEEETSKGGIILPDSAKEKPLEADIVALGTGKLTDDGKTIPFNVTEGDRVLIGKYSGTDVKYDGEDYLILREEDILAIIIK